MAAATNIVFIQYGSASQAKVFNKGWSRVRGTATLPSGQSVATIGNIPNLTNQSIVTIVQQGAYGNTAKIIHIQANDTNGTKGTIGIGSADASVTTSDAAFMFQVVNP